MDKNIDGVYFWKLNLKNNIFRVHFYWLVQESYKREILKLRIENERLKKNYAVRKTDAGELEYIRLKPKNSKL